MQEFMEELLSVLCLLNIMPAIGHKIARSISHLLLELLRGGWS